MRKKDNKNRNLLMKISFLQMNNMKECIDLSRKWKKKLPNS